MKASSAVNSSNKNGCYLDWAKPRISSPCGCNGMRVDGIEYLTFHRPSHRQAGYFITAITKDRTQAIGGSYEETAPTDTGDSARRGRCRPAADRPANPGRVLYYRRSGGGGR